MMFFLAAFSVNELQAQSPACCDIQSCCKISDKRDKATTAFQAVKVSNNQVTKAETKSACCGITSCPLSICQIFCGSGKDAQSGKTEAVSSSELAVLKKE